MCARADIGICGCSRGAVAWADGGIQDCDGVGGSGGTIFRKDGFVGGFAFSFSLGMWS